MASTTITHTETLTFMDAITWILTTRWESVRVDDYVIEHHYVRVHEIDSDGTEYIHDVSDMADAYEFVALSASML